MRTLIPAVLLTFPIALGAQQRAPGAFDFTIANIMRGPELVGRPPQDVRWTPDSRWIYFRWLEPGTDWREDLKPFRVRAAAGATPERVSPAHIDSAGPLLARGDLSRDRTMRAVEHDGDLYVVDLRGGAARRLTETNDRETSPKFDGSGRRVFFVRNDNAFAIDLDGGGLRQLTDIRSGDPPRDSQPGPGQRGSLEREQGALFEVIRDQLRRDSLQKAERERRDSLRTKPFWLRKGERVTTLDVSPNGRALLLVTAIRGADSARQTIVPQYVTRTGYTDELRVRSKVGDAQDSGRVAFVSLPSGDVKWLRVIADDSTRVAAQVSVLGWNDAGTAALVFAVRDDWKARYLHAVSASGAVRTLDVLRDTAWVNGPCFGCGGWIDDRRIWYVSESDGWAHLYTLGADGSGRRQLTNGSWEVTDASLSPDRRWFWLHTLEVSPFERHFYRMAVEGGPRERITTDVGGHEATVSPDGQLIADIHSAANRPPELHVGPFRPATTLVRLTTSPTAAWLAHRWIAPAIVWIPASDGQRVPARIYRPADVGAAPNGAGAIFVHGAGYLHNVHNWWSTYYREYMFNHYLASKGYVVLDIDYRGSAGYGRAWRTAIYRHMGGRDLQDHVDGARYLGKEFGIEPERIGIYGGSYGGFITLMALFTEPEWFGAGAALRSVTDWAHYNHPYTSRILNLPHRDTLAYRRSSPMRFANGLADPLLIAHGMVDVNVHFQDVVRLSQRLIELGKTDWEMAVYPVEDHAFVRPSSWADEYRRIFELFERWLPSRVPVQPDARSVTR